MTVRMFTMPTCGLLRGSGRWPVAQPSTAGGPRADRDLVPPPSIALQDFEAPSSRTVIWSTPWNCSVMPSRSPTICRVDAGAARRRFPAAEEQQPFAVEPGDAGDRRGQCGRRLERVGRSRRPGPSSATSSKGTFCATVIMTCCSLAFGPRLTSQTLLPAMLLRQVGGFVERVAGPGIEHGRQHHLVLERGAGGAGDRLQRLQRVGHDASADDDLERVAHWIRLVLAGVQAARAGAEGNVAAQRVVLERRHAVPEARAAVDALLAVEDGDAVGRA